VVAGATPQPLPVSVLVTDRRGGMVWDRVNLFGHFNDSPEFTGGGPGFTFDGVQFTENVDDPNGDRLYFRWAMGDGQVSYVPNPRYTYEDPGVDGFIVEMTVSDGEHDIGDTQQVYPNVAPIANAGPDEVRTVSRPNTCADVTVDGSASYDPDGTIVAYFWLLDGAFIGSGPQVTQCLSLGTYNFTLLVLDDGFPQGYDLDEAIIRVKKPTKEPPIPHME